MSDMFWVQHTNVCKLDCHQFGAAGRSIAMLIRIAIYTALTALCACSQAPDNALEGRLFPSMELQSVDGKQLEKLQLAGKPTLLNVWATWCAPCRAEMASLSRLHRDYAGRGLAVVGISIDQDRYMVSEYLRTGAVGFRVLIDESGAQVKQFLNTPAVPMTVLVDRHGKIRRLVMGEKDWDSPELRLWVEALLVD